MKRERIAYVVMGAAAVLFFFALTIAVLHGPLR